VSAILVTWVGGVKSILQAAFPAVEVRIGEPDEEDTQNQREKDLILVWLGAWDELQRDIALAAPNVQIRYLPTKSRKQGRDATPDDPTDLYQALEDVMVAMKPHRAFGAVAPRVACHISAGRAVTQPKGSWYVQFTLQGNSAHLATGAA